MIKMLNKLGRKERDVKKGISEEFPYRPVLTVRPGLP